VRLALPFSGKSPNACSNHLPACRYRSRKSGYRIGPDTHGGLFRVARLLFQALLAFCCLRQTLARLSGFEGVVNHKPLLINEYP
jgi:hypothetical protein